MGLTAADFHDRPGASGDLGDRLSVMLNRFCIAIFIDVLHSLLPGVDQIKDAKTAILEQNAFLWMGQLFGLGNTGLSLSPSPISTRLLYRAS
jgi:hypothetical protein